MYPDHSLMPKETIHLAALGMVAEGPMAYGDLAAAVRDFTSHIMGPNLDLMGTSIQILCLEGLISAKDVNGGQPLPSDAMLSITKDGERALENLLLSAIRTPFDDLNKLVIALKMRFFGHLDAAARRTQIDLITTALHGERARLGALRSRQKDDTTALAAWLDHDMAQIEENLRWFEAFKARLG